mgnify:FL=1
MRSSVCRVTYLVCGRSCLVGSLVFVKKINGGYFLILLLYVDDMLIVERDRIKIGMLKKGPKSILLNERNGSGVKNPRDAHNLGMEKEAIVVITGMDMTKILQSNFHDTRMYKREIKT